ncbi:hypothetical protein BO79DRAFT_256994 [Aspergillus costaricaensis CBS 115574]|uniref:Uncharacterized protein n=1 Tax=Aspergillus costaricaensis CBS 115574 TaxID=1448317 RepID=A0ACD1I7T5_9EURO|nr:hypothetical protein BO79DRAFT_256994 [Aspergillus costaricaensis CBS 115574]RAK86585.1 hypothetical protein BO79DRAFT_256994 [Aspergillus costaricaensis CBS 115574]
MSPVSYYVNAAGSNLQNLCHNTHMFNTPTSQALADQAIGRVLCVGQSQVVKISEYVVHDSFNTSVFIKDLTKAIPDPVATLNWELLRASRPPILVSGFPAD